MASLYDIAVVDGAADVSNTQDKTGIWRVSHAARELQRYLQQMGDAEIPVVADPRDTDKPCLIVVGAGSHNATTTWLVEDGHLILGLPEAGGDGYAMRYACVDGRHYLVLAGETPVSTLWAVYHYLEEFGRCGFFMDGDFVPKLSFVPLERVNFESKPAFPLRDFLSTYCGGFGLRKFHYLFRRFEDWTAFIDWLCKRRFNLSGFMMGYMGREAFLNAFGLSDEPEGERYVDGFSDGWTYPHRFFKELTQQVLQYGRDRGLKFYYFMGYGAVPESFKEAHPQYRYADHVYGSALFHPDEPAGRDYMKRYYEKVIETFGTDHMYFDTPYAEDDVSDDYDEAVAFKLKALQSSIAVMREADPEAIPFISAWDFHFQRDRAFSPERVKRYMDGLPDDALVMENNSVEWDRFYARNGYYQGKRWAFGVLQGYQGDDHLHGDMEGAIRKTREALADPMADKLVCFSHVPEYHGANIMYFQLTATLSWNPAGVTREGFIRDYALRRYGHDSARAMEAALTCLADAVYSGVDVLPWHKATPFYKRFGPEFEDSVVPLISFFDFTRSNFKNYNQRTVRLLRQSLELALSQRFQQRSNRLYENDVIDIAKCYWAHCSNLELIRAFDGFSAGDHDRFEAGMAGALELLHNIELLLSTREDFHLMVQIREVEACPGSNPYSARMMKQALVNKNYATNDVYELFPFFYIPKLESWADMLREKLDQGIHRVEYWDEFKPRGDAIRKAFVDNPIEVPDDRKFSGTPIDCVVALLDGADTGVGDGEIVDAMQVTFGGKAEDSPPRA